MSKANLDHSPLGCTVVGNSEEAEAKHRAWAQFQERKYRAELVYNEVWDTAIEEYRRAVSAAETRLMRTRDEAWRQCKAEIDRALLEREREVAEAIRMGDPI